MPPKRSPTTTQQQQQAGRKPSRKKEAGVTATSAVVAASHHGDRNGNEGMEADPLPALAALPTTAVTNPRRTRLAQQFKELATLILSSDANYQLSMRGHAAPPAHGEEHRQQRQPPSTAHAGGSGTISAAGASSVGEDYFPTLQVGFLARAMGLNLTEEQVVQLVQLVEDDGASRGAVSRRRLEGVVIDALVTGVLGGPTLVSRGVLTPQQMPSGWQPSCCLRSDDDTIYRAFAAIDGTGKGYLTSDELRLAMTTMGDPLSAEEMEEMLVAMVEPGTDAIYYKDFATVLARE